MSFQSSPLSVLPGDEGAGKGAGGAHSSHEVPDQQVQQEEGKLSTVKQRVLARPGPAPHV